MHDTPHPRLYTIVFFLLALTFLSNLVWAQDITSGLALLEENRKISWTQYVRHLFAIPSAHAQTADLLTGLIGHWKFDETSGTTAVDSSGNNNTGTLTNSPLWTTGKIGGALSFDGVNDYMDAGSPASLTNLGAITVSAWINPTSITNPNSGIVMKARGPDGYFEGWSFFAHNESGGAGDLVFDAQFSVTSLRTSTIYNTILNGEWQHVAVVWDGSTTAANVHFYRNGVEIAKGGSQSNTNGSGTRDNDNIRNLLIASGNINGGFLPGLIDDMRIYNRVLTIADVQALYALGSGTSSPPPPSGDIQLLTTPTNLTATAQSSSQINLSWTASTDNVGVTGYRVERCQGSSCTNFTQVATPSGTTYNDTGLSANITYRYQVRAVDAAGNFSNYSSVVSATTQTTMPPPTGGTVLGNLAASMAPGTWKIVPMQNIDLTAQAFYPNAGAPGPGYDGTQPGWNSKKRKLYIETVEHGATSDCSNFPNMPHICFKPLITYDDATDLWSINGPTPGASTGGVQGYHHYYEVAWDDENEVIYIRQFYSGNFYRYCVNNTPSWCAGKQGVWTQLPAMNLWASCCQQLMYHPTLNGGTLLYFDGAAGSTSGAGCGALIGFKESTGAWSTIHNGAGCFFPVDAYSDIGAYSTAKQLAVFGGGAPKHMWKIDQNGTIAQLDDAPFAIGSSNGKFASLAADPVSGNFILIGGTAAGQMWELNPTAAPGAQWTLLDNSLNATGEICNVVRNTINECSLDFYATPISTYGVIGYWKWVNTTNAEYWLYKHAIGGASPPSDTTPPTIFITAPANGSTVSGSSVSVSANASDNVGVVGVQFLLDGANLGTEDLTSSYSISWDTTIVVNGSHTLTARARDAAGNQTTSSSVTVTVNNTAPPPGGSDFQTRCSQPGVIRCIGFDQASDIANTLWGGNTGIDTNGTSIPTLDSSVKASGNSALKFTIPSNSPANSSGSYWANFSADLATQFGGNSDFYIQWQQRFSPEFITTAYAGGGGWKQAIITTGDKAGCTTSNSTNCYASCTALGVVTQNSYHRRFAQMYNSCTGSSVHPAPYWGFEEPYGSYDFKLQNARSSPYCLYSQSSTGYFPPNGNCFGYTSNEWMTFNIQITTGPRVNDVFTNSFVRLWIGREGQPSELAILWGPWDLAAGPNGENQSFGKVWLLPYNTGKDSSVSNPTAYTWYDELIVSRNKIADPGTTPPPTPLLGDLNGDRTVNNFDWNIMVSVWFTNDPVADINKDGIVNTADYYYIYANWGKSI